jgi:hypothetical protein
MNPALAAISSAGFAGAVVIVVNAIFGWLTGKTVDQNVVTAETTIVTSLAGVAAHYLTRVVPPAPPSSATPSASGNQAP